MPVYLSNASESSAISSLEITADRDDFSPTTCYSDLQTGIQTKATETEETDDEILLDTLPGQTQNAEENVQILRIKRLSKLLGVSFIMSYGLHNVHQEIRE